MQKAGTFLIHTRQYDIFIRDYKIVIYKVTTSDIFHTVGEIYYRTLEALKRVTFSEWTEERERYWTDQGCTIHSWHDKYQ